MLLALAAPALLSACSSTIDVPPPAPTDAAAQVACARLVATLPGRLDGHERRRVAPRDALAAAWGDPPIVLRCGVGAPPLDISGEQPDVEVDGVTWRPVSQRDGYLFTTLDRVAYVEVRVPSAYAPEVNPLVDLAGPVKQTVPVSAGR